MIHIGKVSLLILPHDIGFNSEEPENRDGNGVIGKGRKKERREQARWE